MSANIIVAVFPSRAQLLKALDSLNDDTRFDIQRAAIIAKASSGEIVFIDDDISANEGGVAGGTLGAAVAALGMVQFGALALPGVGPIVALGAGVLVGGLVGRYTGRFAANLLDFGYKNDQIEALAEELQQGHPALILVIDNAKEHIRHLRLALKQFDAELVEPLAKAQTGKLRDLTARS